MPPTRPNTAAPTNDPRGQPIGPRTRDWANDVGYDVGAPGPDRVHDRRPRGRDRAGLQIAALRRSLPRPAAAPMLTANFDGPIAVKRGLKGDKGKKTCLVDIDGSTFVVKGGTEMAAEHVAASAFIGSLGWPGVRAPATRLLDASEKAKLIAALSKGDHHAQELAASLGIAGVDGREVAQISEPLDGSAMKDIFPDKDLRSAETLAQGLRSGLAEVDPAQAWSRAVEDFAKLVETHKDLNQTKRHAPTIRTLAAITGNDARSQALEALRSLCHSPQSAALADVLGEVLRGDVQAAHARAQSKEKARPRHQEALKAFAASDEGIEAFAGMAAADLLTGMGDRVMGKWNGGNFLFDAQGKKLCCIDNAKEAGQTLTAKGNEDWRTFVDRQLKGCASLEDALFRQLYESHLGNESANDALFKHVSFDDDRKASAKALVRQVLLKMIAQVVDPKVHGQAAVERAAYLKARMELEDILKPDPTLATPPAQPAKIGAADKAGRAVSGLVSGRKIRDETQKIKDELRKGTLSAADAKTRLLVLQQQQQSLATDRRSAKIELLIGAGQFRATLVQKQGELDAMVKVAPQGLWTADTAKALGTPLRAALQAWLAAVAKDARTTAQLNQAWGQFPAEVRSA